MKNLHFQILQENTEIHTICSIWKTNSFNALVELAVDNETTQTQETWNRGTHVEKHLIPSSEYTAEVKIKHVVIKRFANSTEIINIWQKGLNLNQTCCRLVKRRAYFTNKPPDLCVFLTNLTPCDRLTWQKALSLFDVNHLFRFVMCNTFKSRFLDTIAYLLFSNKMYHLFRCKEIQLRRATKNLPTTFNSLTVSLK